VSECRSLMGMILTGKNWSLWDQLVPASLCLPQIPHGLARDWIRTSVTNRLSSDTGLNVCEIEQGAEENVLGKAGKEEQAVGQCCITNRLSSSTLYCILMWLGEGWWGGQTFSMYERSTYKTGSKETLKCETPLETQVWWGMILKWILKKCIWEWEVGLCYAGSVLRAQQWICLFRKLWAVAWIRVQLLAAQVELDAWICFVIIWWRSMTITWVVFT